MSTKVARQILQWFSAVASAVNSKCHKFTHQGQDELDMRLSYAQASEPNQTINSTILMFTLLIRALNRKNY